MDCHSAIQGGKFGIETHIPKAVVGARVPNGPAQIVHHDVRARLDIGLPIGGLGSGDLQYQREAHHDHTLKEREKFSKYAVVHVLAINLIEG